MVNLLRLYDSEKKYKQTGLINKHHLEGNNMKEQFVTYEIALKLRELGFNEECFAFFNGKFIDFKIDNFDGTECYQINPNKNIGNCINAPLWQQVIDWFREKHDVDVEIHSSFGSGGWWWANLCYNPTRTEVLNIARFENYYEARKQAILKAIELIKKK